MHSQPYQGHRMACATALEVQQIIQADGLLENVKKMGSCLENSIKAALLDHPHVDGVRGKGLF